MVYLPRLSFTLLSTLALALLASPSPAAGAALEARAASDNTVYINSVTDHCMVLPRSKHTNVGDSEHPGGMRSFCMNPQGNQGQLPKNFWSEVYLSKKAGKSGRRQIQLTGCIRPSTSAQLNSNDGGGQYDGHGGAGGRGNPAGSVCTGYKYWMELVEPDVRRACIRCCDSAKDCDLSKDTSGCPVAIPGKYGRCA